MKNRFYHLLILQLFISISINAQTALPNNPANLPNDFNLLLKPETTDGWVVLKDSLYVNPDSLFTKYKSFWGVSS